MATRKRGGVCWAVLTYDRREIVDTGETRADALRKYTWRFGGNPTGDVVRIRWSIVTPAKNPAKKGRKK